LLQVSSFWHAGSLKSAAALPDPEIRGSSGRRRTRSLLPAPLICYNAGPRFTWFRLRTLFAVVTLAVALGWVMYQLDWIRHRHEFLKKHGGLRYESASTSVTSLTAAGRMDSRPIHRGRWVCLASKGAIS